MVIEKMKKFLTIAVFLSAISMTFNTFAWNTGHDEIQKLVNENLPDHIKKRFSAEELKMLADHYSHYPDNHDSFDTEEVGDYAMELLKKLNIKKRYHLHSATGVSASFVLLAESFRRKDYRRSIIWIGSLGHSMADETAFNHDPFIHFLTYHLWKYKLRTTPLFNPEKLIPYLDITRTAKEKEYKKTIDALFKDYRPLVISLNPEDAILDVLMRISSDYPDYEARHSSTLLVCIKGFAMNKDPEAQEQYIELMCELAALSAKDIINTIVTADSIADKNISLSVDHEKLLQDFSEKLSKKYRTKPLSEEFYQKAIEGSLPKSDIGIVVEPFYSFDKGMLSPLWRYLAPALALFCQNHNIKYSILDIRNIYENGFPSPANVPICILDAGEYRDFMWMKRAVFEEKLKLYHDAGGKIIWIGGKISSALNMDKFMTLCDPAEKTYSGIDGEKIGDAMFLLSGAFGETLAGKYAFENSPETKEGWNKPYCPYKVDKCDDVYIWLESGKESIPVVWKHENIIFIPEYVVAPYLIDISYNLKTLETPSLDRFSAEIFNWAIHKFK